MLKISRKGVTRLFYKEDAEEDELLLMRFTHFFSFRVET